MAQAFYPPSFTRTGNPQTMVYMNLQPPVGTARRSPVGWWSLTPPSHPYPHRSEGGHSLLPSPTVTNSFYFRKWSALCCPDFPLAIPLMLRRCASDRPWQCFLGAKVRFSGQITKLYSINYWLCPLKRIDNCVFVTKSVSNS